MQKFDDDPLDEGTSGSIAVRTAGRGWRSRWWHPSIPSLRIVYLAAEQESRGIWAGEAEAGGASRWEPVWGPVGRTHRPTLTVS